MKRFLILCLVAVSIFACNKVEKQLNADIMTLETKYNSIVQNANIAIQGDMEAYAKCVAEYVEIKKLHNAINENLLKLDVGSTEAISYKAAAVNATTKNYFEWISLGLHDMSFFKKADVEKINKEIFPEN